ncbi:MAG: hypothetical protein ACREMV_05135 [Gemmatimonadales bacterium]
MINGLHAMLFSTEPEALRARPSPSCGPGAWSSPMPPSDAGCGWVTHFTMPGGVRVQLYQPR